MCVCVKSPTEALLGVFDGIHSPKYCSFEFHQGPHNWRPWHRRGFLGCPVQFMVATGVYTLYEPSKIAWLIDREIGDYTTWFTGNCDGPHRIGKPFSTN